MAAPTSWHGQSYKTHRGGTDMTFYHVVDNLSQTPYRPGYGIRCGCKNEGRDRRIENIITRARMRQHLDWTNRNKTQCISLWIDKDKAYRQARMRANQLSVRDPLTGQRVRRDPRTIEIVEISSKVLDEAGVFYFSTQWMKKVLDLKPGGQMWKFLSKREWIALARIPDECIIQVLRWEDIQDDV